MGGDMARIRSKRKLSGTKTNKAGRELLEAVREAHRAVTTGDFSGITIREVEIPARAITARLK